MGWDLLLPRGRAGEDETVGGFLRRRLGGAVVSRLAGPLLGGIYAGDADALSLRATFPQLLEWETSHRSLVLAAIARRRVLRRNGTRRTGTRDTGTGIPSAGTGSPSPLFLSLVGGLGELVERLEASLGSTTVMTGRTVTRIARRVERGRTSYTLHLDDGRPMAADALLLATPAFITADLLASLAPAVASALRQIPYVSTASVTLAYRRETVRHPLDGHGFVVARDEPLNIAACTWVSSKWPHRAPPDVALLRCYVGAAGRETVVECDDATLVDLARADLRTTMGIDATPVFTAAARWIRAMPQYPPGHLDRLDLIEAGMQTLPGVALAGAGYGGIGIPDCIRQGTEAAARLIEPLVSSEGRLAGVGLSGAGPSQPELIV
jgi:oxygen-dependent protoporphyrinogen oxidase